MGSIMKSEPSAPLETCEITEEDNVIEGFLRMCELPPFSPWVMSQDPSTDSSHLEIPQAPDLHDRRLEITLFHKHRTGSGYGQEQHSQQPSTSTSTCTSTSTSTSTCTCTSSTSTNPSNITSTSDEPTPTKKRRKGKLLLWQFLLMDLLQGHSNLKWLDDQVSYPGVFVFKDPNQTAKRWGAYKENENMSYEKMSRCIRDYWIREDNKYYRVMVQDPIKGRRLHFAYNLQHKDVRQFIQKNSSEYYQSLVDQGIIGS